MKTFATVCLIAIAGVCEAGTNLGRFGNPVNLTPNDEIPGLKRGHGIQSSSEKALDPLHLKDALFGDKRNLADGDTATATTTSAATNGAATTTATTSPTADALADAAGAAEDTVASAVSGWDSILKVFGLNGATTLISSAVAISAVLAF